MKASLSTAVSDPAVLAVGSWDAFGAEHQTMLRRMSAYAQKHGRSSVAALFSPPPPAYVSDDPDWPVFEAPDVRTHRIHQCGIDAVLTISFSQDDLGGTAADLLDVLRDAVPMAELWFGADQTFGRGSKGSQIAMCSHLKTHGIEWTRLPESDARSTAGTVRGLLNAGKPNEAARVVGRPPVWSRTHTAGTVHWPPGAYTVVPLEAPDDVGDPARRHRVVVEPTTNHAGILPPSALPAPYAAVCHGPSDEGRPSSQDEPSEVSACDAVAAP